MPLNGHSYLVAKGWSGKGNGLRTGAISKPLVVHQKKTLAGLGKDRDEAFPFWDHLFSAAASAINIRLSSDEEQNSHIEGPSNLNIKRTTTGIISNRRPVTGTLADLDLDSGATTPDSTPSRLSLLASAKREAAKRGLYSRFFKGSVLGPHEPESIDCDPSSSKMKSVGEIFESEAYLTRKVYPAQADGDIDAGKAVEKERKRQRKEARDAKEAEEATSKLRREKAKAREAKTERGSGARKEREEEKKLKREARKSAEATDGALTNEQSVCDRKSHNNGPTGRSEGRHRDELFAPKSVVHGVDGKTKSNKRCHHIADGPSDILEEQLARKKRKRKEKGSEF